MLPVYFWLYRLGAGGGGHVGVGIMSVYLVYTKTLLANYKGSNGGRTRASREGRGRTIINDSGSRRNYVTSTKCA